MEQDGYVILETLKQICGPDLEGIDCAIDCVGYEAGEAGKSFGHGHNEPEQAINTCLCVVNAGGRVSFPGLFLPIDPQGPSKQHKTGEINLKMGQAFIKQVNIIGGRRTKQIHSCSSAPSSGAVAHFRLLIALLPNVFCAILRPRIVNFQASVQLSSTTSSCCASSSTEGCPR